jgi:glutaredoxin
MGKIEAYCRIGCPHSDNTRTALNNLKSSDSTLEITIISIENNESEKTEVKNNLKSIIGNHETFPIIIYTRSSGKKYFVGGNSHLQGAMNIYNSISNLTDEENILKLCSYGKGAMSKGCFHMLLYLMLKRDKLKKNLKQKLKEKIYNDIDV